MKPILRILFGVLLGGGLACLPAPAQGNGNSQGRGHGNHGGNTPSHGSIQNGFGPHDRQAIAQYYEGRTSGLPPGLAKRGGDLPPGLERQLQRNGTLPPGLEKKLQPCPPELEQQLTPLPADYQRAVVGVDIVIFNRRTNLIVDIIKGVVR